MPLHKRDDGERQTAGDHDQRQDIGERPAADIVAFREIGDLMRDAESVRYAYAQCGDATDEISLILTHIMLLIFLPGRASRQENTC